MTMPVCAEGEGGLQKKRRGKRGLNAGYGEKKGKHLFGIRGVLDAYEGGY